MPQDKGAGRREDLCGTETVAQAIARGDLAAAYALLEKGQPLGIRALHYLCGRLNPDGYPNLRLAPKEAGALMKRLIAAGADPNQADADGETPLTLEIDRRAPERHSAASWLLDLGADPSTEGRLGKTPLIMALERRSLPMVRLLLKAGADPAALNCYGWSAAMLARRLRCSVSLFPPADPLSQRQRALLHLFASVRRMDFLKQALRAGAAVDDPDHSGASALIAAVREQRLDAVEALLAVGASVNGRDRTGYSARDWAALFADHPASPNARRIHELVSSRCNSTG